MIDNYFLEELGNIKVVLDKSGLHAFAADVGAISEEYSKKILDERYSAIFSVIKSALVSAVSDSSKPGINEKSITDILGVVDSVSKQYQVPAHKFYIEKGTDAAFIPKAAYGDALSLAEMMNDIKSLKQQLHLEKDPVKVESIRGDLKDSTNAYESFNKKIEELKNSDSEVYAAVKKYIDYAVNRVGKQFSIYPR